MEPYNIHITLTSGEHESRLLRETEHLITEGIFSRVDIFALGSAELETRVRLESGVTIFRFHLYSRWLPRILGLQAFKYFEWLLRMILFCRSRRPRVVTLHGLDALVAGFFFKKIYGSRVVYAPHELETESNSLEGFRKLVCKWIEAIFIRYMDQVIVVNSSIRDWYCRRYNLENVAFVRNVPNVQRVGAESGKTKLKSIFKIPEKHFLFIYQGALARGRGIEILIEVFKVARPDRHIVFLGYGALERSIREASISFTNIHFHPAVAPSEVMGYTQSADVGVSLIESTCLSYYLSLPNKLFEYIYAGLPVIASSFPEMKALIEGEGLGWSAVPSPEEVLELVNGMSWELVAEAKEGVRKFCEVPIWPKEREVLTSVYRRVLM